MKKLLLTIAILASVVGVASGALKTFNGANNSTWATAGTWSPSGAPANGDTAYFSGTPNANVVITAGTNNLARFVVDPSYTDSIKNNGYQMTISPTNNGIIFDQGGAIISQSGSLGLNFLPTNNVADTVKKMIISGTGLVTVTGNGATGGSLVFIDTIKSSCPWYVGAYSGAQTGLYRIYFKDIEMHVASLQPRSFASSKSKISFGATNLYLINFFTFAGSTANTTTDTIDWGSGTTHVTGKWIDSVMYYNVMGTRTMEMDSTGFWKSYGHQYYNWQINAAANNTDSIMDSLNIAHRFQVISGKFSTNSNNIRVGDSAIINDTLRVVNQRNFLTMVNAGSYVGFNNKSRADSLNIKYLNSGYFYAGDNAKFHSIVSTANKKITFAGKKIQLDSLPSHGTAGNLDSIVGADVSKDTITKPTETYIYRYLKNMAFTSMQTCSTGCVDGGNNYNVTFIAAGPLIQSQTTDTSVWENTTASFQVAATGIGSLSYQWTRNGVNIVGATSSGYSYTAPFADKDTTFACKITDDNATVTSANIHLTVTRSTITISNAFPDSCVFQRDSGHTYYTIPLTGTLSAIGADSVIVKLTMYNDDAIVIDWTKIATFPSTVWSGNLQVACGGFYKLRVQVEYGGVAICSTVTTNPWAVGSVVGLIGQSNAQGRGPVPYTIANSNVMVFDYTSKTWKHLSDPVGIMDGAAGGSMGPMLGNTLSDSLGWPVGIVMYAVGSTGLVGGTGSYWCYRNSSSHDDISTLYGAALKQFELASVNGNGLEGVVYFQGETDAQNGAIGRQQYLDSLRNMINNFRSDIPKKPKFFIAQINRRTAGGPDPDSQWTKIRDVHDAVDSSLNNVYFSSVTYDQALVDGIHLTSRAQDTVGMRVARSVLYSIGSSSWYRGPRITGITNTTATKRIVKMTITKQGNGFYPATGYTGFQWRKISDNSWNAPDSMRKVNQDLYLYCSDSTDSIRYAYGEAPTITTLLKDSTYLHLPLEPLAPTKVQSSLFGPVILSQPQNKTVNDFAPCTLSVTATASAGSLHYQWRKASSNVGTDANKYIFTGAYADNGAKFCVIVTDGNGSTVSDTAVLTVTAIAPVISSQPANVRQAVARTASFGVGAYGTGSLTYQWSDSTAAHTWQAIGGATSSGYTTGTLDTTYNGNKYRCVVTNATGSTTSNAALLTVVLQLAANQRGPLDSYRGSRLAYRGGFRSAWR